MTKVWNVGLVSILLAACALDAEDPADDPAGSETDPGGSTGGGPRDDAMDPAASQDPWFIDAKSSFRLRIDADGHKTDSALALTVYPTAKTLDTSTTKYVIEPEGTTSTSTKKDDKGTAYTDRNYWNFCAPGAEAVVLFYSPWRNNPKYGTIDTYYTEPSYSPYERSTFWTSPSDDKTYGYHTFWRPSIMYLAEYSKPPSYSTRGVDNFSTYPITGSKGVYALRDSLNWEASDHSSGYADYFYATVSGSTSFHSHVVYDVNATAYGWTGWALYVVVNPYVDSTHRLPNWSHNLNGGAGRHAIAVVGYDDTAKTYKYLDTCGYHCNSSSGNNVGSSRVFTVSQSVLHSIMTSHVW